MKETVLIASLARVSKNAPWRVGIFINNYYTYIHVGDKGNVATSPRFFQFLSEVEKKVGRYPVDISFHQLTENREMQVTRLKDQIVYIDCGFVSTRLIPHARIKYQKEVMGSPLSAVEDGSISSGDFKIQEVYDSFGSNSDYVAICSVAAVDDGDTIDVIIQKGTEMLTSHGFEEQKKYTIRYNGIDCPEKWEDTEHRVIYKDPKNANFGRIYGVTMQDMYDVAAESKAFNEKQLGFKGVAQGNPLVIIHFDREYHGGPPVPDAGYGRWMGDVYGTQEMNAQVLYEKIKSGQQFVHINKSLLVEKSKAEKTAHVPLAIFQFQWAPGGKTVLNPLSWVTELDIDPIDTGDGRNPGMIDPDLIVPPVEEDTDKSEVPTKNLNTDGLIFADTEDAKPNNHDFFQPYDDRILEFTKGITNEKDLPLHSKVRIGDCILTIPPISIEVDKVANIQKVKTLRTKSSVLVNSGHTLTTLKMDLYFHDLESINGRMIPWKPNHKKGEKTGEFAVDGLRPLLAQFSKAPFLPIDNYYINEILGVQDVALMDLEVTTVPNFPESLSATITLVEFNSEAYFLDHSTLNQSINYPLLRYFYNQSMADRGSKYRYFKGLEGQMTNELTFTLADADYLQQRKDAMEWMKNKDSPEKLRLDLKKNTTYKAKKADAAKAKEIIRQYESYSNFDLKTWSVIDIVSDTELAQIQPKLMNRYRLFSEEAENAILEGAEFFQTLYDGKFKSNPMTMWKDENVFLPYETRPFYTMRLDQEEGDSIFGLFDKAPYENHRDKGLFVFEKFQSQENQDLMEKSYPNFYQEKSKRFFIPAFSYVINILKEIAKGAREMTDAIDEYEDNFNDYMRIIEASELGVPMNIYEINGTLIPISLKATYSNEFSMMQIIAGEGATLQFMGGGDACLQMVLEMDEQAAQDFSRLLRISDEYAKQYNQGITNGYIGVKNDLANLFGMRYLMFESVKISTVPGSPGRYQVFIDACGFDKTQRQREELTAIPGNTTEMDLETLENNKYSYANDRLIQARLNKLEVYPDLELPTYEEVNAALPFIDAKCSEYKNLSGGTYVDPDFYFSTISTFRQKVEEMYKGTHQVNMFDATGVAAFTNSTAADKLFDTTKEDWQKLDELQKTEGVEPLGWVFNWQKANEQTPASDGSVVSNQGGMASYQNPDLLKWLEEKNTDGTPAYMNFPTEGGWNYLFGNDYDYEDFQENPSEIDIYKALDDLIDKYFKSYYSKPDFIKECKGDLNEADKTTKLISYSSADDLYSAVFSYYYEGGGDPMTGGVIIDRDSHSKIKSLIKKKDLTIPPKTDRVDSLDFMKVKAKVTKERFMTIMKAFLDKTSGWQHFKGDKPMLSKTGRAGIAQVDITGKDMKVDEAKKLLYNWRYNLEMAISQLAGHYKKVKGLDKDCKNFEVYCRPWDAMFALYQDPTKTPVRNKDILDSDIASGVISRFNNYAYLPFNTYGGFNQTIYKSFVGLDKDEKVALGMGKKSEIIDGLLNYEYYDLNVLKKAGLKVDSDKNAIRKVMKEYLETLKKKQLFDLYVNHLRNLAALYMAPESVGDKVGHWLSHADKNGYRYEYKLLNQAYKLYNDSIKALNKAVNESQKANDTRLFNDVDPHMIYQEMFHDLRTYDQRGRMIRAFPGFQMFIIHEGSWFGKYKFWDNMYGFNAIQSIDVYRSRKIAADTAVISMTNVYSNLTTRRTDVDFVDRELKWWDNYIWNEIPQDLIDKKEKEIHKNIYLETGARIHLRMGYNANASELPIVFNGTITEMEVGDVVQIVASGDGVELGNVVSGDPEDDNDGLFSVTEPRDLICSLLSSKGSWFKDYMHGETDGLLFKDNPLGIMHFGQPWDTSDNTSPRPLGNLLWYNDEYGEVAQNVYSSNGSPTFSQWLHPNGERNNIFSDFTWKHFWDNKFKIFNPGDEKNVVIKFYNNTVWDIFQTITYTSPDYICAVHPFELRSTLFFGKPYWRCAFQYDSTYEFDPATKMWVRHLTKEARRPYMQHKFYNSHYDVIQNNIKASEDNVYTNVIVNYDGNQTPVLYADADIRFDKQKTRVVEADIVAKLGDFYTSEVMATYFGQSALRDNLKDMYKGNLLVLGDPSVKPYDMAFVSDDINDLQGNFLVKAVTHHFSLETGFVSSIEPDLLVVNDDQVILEIGKWYWSFGTSLTTTLITQAIAKKALKNLWGWLSKSDSLPASVGKWLNTKGLRHSMHLAGGNLGLKEWQACVDTLDEIIKEADPTKVKGLYSKLTTQFEAAEKALPKATGKLGAGAAKDFARKGLLKSGGLIAKALANSDDIAKIAKGVIGAIRGVASFTPIGFIVNMAIWIGTEMLFEHYRRYKENMQSVVAIPLTYRGKELTAGINNHAGMIYGDNPGFYDRLFDSTFGYNDGEDVEGMWGGFLIEALNTITGQGGMYRDQAKAQQLKEMGIPPEE